MAVNIVWFRNDLRIRYNAALSAALAEGCELSALFILDNRKSKLGEFRRRFITESLADLAENLNQYNIRFDVRSGIPKEELSVFFDAHTSYRVFANKGYASEEIGQEKLLQSIPSVELCLFDDGFLIPPHCLPFEIDELPDTFTTFRKKIEQVGIESMLDAPTDNLPSVVRAQGNIGMDSANPNTAFPFRGGEYTALERLKNYLWNSRNILNYKETRNGLLGTEYSSKFSPWLANGCISAQEIFFEIKAFEREVESNASTYWLIFELLWRDYFRYVMLKYGTSLFKLGGIRGKEINRFEPFDASDRFDAWVNGQTGDDFVDANMRELKLTGFMSNRGRQNVTSFLVHQLKLDWRKGAAYFEKQLIDYDVFSNWGNWAYLAGVGNDPRENRVFNTKRQAEMYDPGGEYIRKWLD
jgi:deoxyribodipyrimidine photo-lyase